MFSVNSSMNQTSDIIRILISSTCDGNVKLQSIQNLKSFFRPPEKTLKNIKLKSLLKEGGILLKSNSHKKDFLITYGKSLINYIGKDGAFDLELFNQLEFILINLQQQDENLVVKLYTKICELQSESFLHFSGILNVFKLIFERRLLNWIENNDDLEIKFLAKMSASSPVLFQILASILHSITVRAFGHWRVFEVTSAFISLVISICTKTGKDFIGLYPENCRRIVSLLIVPPELYSDEIIKNEVLDLLMELFLLDKKKTLILLTHYSDWLCVFRNYHLKKNINR